ncbi:MAG: triose-phosphate isomerase [Pseudomonadota bacterium]|nr:triose-phosphate isomerase [Pseudomonadota bacterium]
MRRKLVAGNWKMHGSRDFADVLAQAIVDDLPQNCDVAIFPPFPYLIPLAAQHREDGLAVGAQDVSEHGDGAYTGEVSAAMLRDAGCDYALAGHSERRHYHHETDNQVAAKVTQALQHDLVAVLCVGETLEQHDAGRAREVVSRQLQAVIDRCGIDAFDRIVLAYEPVWAIGSGQCASPAQAQDIHALLRSQLAAADAKIASSTRILYGGSVKPDNALDLFAQPDVDGGLIGGASLKAADFLRICAAAR